MAIGAGVEDLGGPLRRLFGEGGVSGMGEGELLRRFAGSRDPLAMEVLVARHGPMVLGVCRRVLPDHHASDDAFQATFLILARKAGSIRDPDRLGPWLHGVAHRVAVRSRANLARRRAREGSGAEDLAAAPGPLEGGEAERAELRAALDDEVGRLPAKFRDPVVLCYLDGLTHDEAATRLRCPVGTVRSRLSTARARLRDRLTRRGVVVPSAGFEAALAQGAGSAAVPPSLMVSTVKAASAFAGGLAGAAMAGMVPVGAASLAKGVLLTMTVTKMMIAGGLALAGMLALGVGGVAAYQAGGAPAGKPSVETHEALSKKVLDDLPVVVKPDPAMLKEIRAELRAVLAANLQDDASKAQAGKPAEETGESQFAKLKKQVADSEARAGRLQKELDAVVAKLEAAGTGPRSPTANGAAPAAKAGRPGGAAGGMGLPAGGGEGGGAGLGLPGGGGSGMSIRGMGGNGLGRGFGGESLAQIQGNDFVIVHKPGSAKVSAYSSTTGEWTSYEASKGMDVVPIAGPGVVALMGVGDEIRQIAAFVPGEGRWFPIDLKEQAAGKAVPIVGPGQAAYAIGRRVYAFSGPAKSWDVLELPEGANPTPIVFTTRITVEHADHLHIFSIKTGKWTDFDASKGRVVGPGAE